jgi:acyl carrier protein
VAPRTETERLLAETWAEVLGVARCGVHDNFFDLGGHSLMATQLISRLAPRFGVEIPLGELFDRPTIAALADLIDARRAAQEAADVEAERELLDRLEHMSEAEARALLGEAPAKQESSPTSQRAVPATGAAPTGRINGATQNGKHIVISVGEANSAEREAHRS